MVKFNFNVLACNIRTLRKKLNLTQEEVGIKCGLSQNTISDLENGFFYPTYIHTILLCECLGCKAEQLYSYYIDTEDI